MNKTQFEEKVSSYNEYVSYNMPYVVPTIGVNSGNVGRLFEMTVKSLMNNYKGNFVSRAGHADTTKKVNGKIQSIEIKSGCGELAKIDSNGIHWYKSPITVYSYDGTIENAVVMETSHFFDLLEACELIRFKRSSHYNASCGYEYDRITIQSFKNSKKKFRLWTETLSNELSLTNWLETL